MTDETQIDYRAKYLKRCAEKDKLAKQLTDSQRESITNAFKALREAEWSLQEMFDITIDDARNISRAENLLSQSFPELCDRNNNL